MEYVCYNLCIKCKEQIGLLQPEISVIIPVYNAEHVVKTAVESVFSQDVENIEVILIDDGSRDNSLSVCQGLQKSDPRIQVISQANGGPGSARNAGLRIAKGKYICFVDSDDSMAPGALKKMLQAIQGADMVIAHFNIDINNQIYDRGYISTDSVFSRKEFLKALAHRPGSYYYSALWNKLYSREIIHQHQLAFDHEFSWGEDFLFNMRFYHHVNHVSFLSTPVYNYKRTLSGQTWRTMFDFGRSFAIKAKLYKSLKHLYVKSGEFHKYRPHIYRYIFNVTLSK